MKKTIVFLVAFTQFSIFSQIHDTCKLNVGTNLSSVFDWGTEIPFVDMMKMARKWYTKAVNDPTWTFDTQQAQYLQYDSCGYPLFIPQASPNHSLMQYVCTIWAVTDGWEPGQYTLLWDGNGQFSYTGNITNWTQVGPNTITFNFPNPVGSQLQLCIVQSSSLNPVRNIRLIMPGQLSTFSTQPFNPKWLNLVKKFNSVRFMDWGRTNDWGQPNPWTVDTSKVFQWNERSKVCYYTYTHEKGIPYEYMVKLMNDHDLDGWVCVPHNAGNQYIQKMAEFFRDNLEPERHLVVEFSNEIWNWIFGQTDYLYKKNHCGGSNPWPECIVPSIQNNLNIWTQVFQGQLHRITRTVGLFTSWLDVSKRITFNLNPNTFDAVSPTYYFGISLKSDSLMDALGPSTTVQYLTQRVRIDRSQNEFVWIKQMVDSVAKSLNKKVYFYEGGQHITAHPFGVMPSYSTALLNIQRDTAMYNLYVQNYNYLKSIHTGSIPWWCMNFSLVSPLSAQYGSWGILETLNQDTTLIPAPKLSATLKYISKCNQTVSISENNFYDNYVSIYPNPALNKIYLKLNDHIQTNDLLVIYNVLGKKLDEVKIDHTRVNEINLEGYKPGVYFINIKGKSYKFLVQ
jgi:hypothetical protein